MATGENRQAMPVISSSLPTPARLSCRPGCGACCIAPSISSPIPGMPLGKPAGVRCIQLDENNRCLIFGQASRPAVCGQLQAAEDMCGDNDVFALTYLTRLERLTTPGLAR